MDPAKALKVGLAILAILVALPFLVRLWPEPLTMERIRQGFEASGLPVEGMRLAPKPSNESVSELNFMVGGVSVAVYQYDNAGTIARYQEYNRKDPGTAIVESWNLAQSLGAAVPKQTPTRCVRRGYFLLVAIGDDVATLNRVVEVFEQL
ncbi:MAG TPA: hypothetical protein PLO53_04920 [Candidatus Hydrogenedentes bacterium]|nr:hypothetical protein [Candidatus Hydrogenedentota bacterium]HPU97283.1 hypothetical protein [Candidatus Hydrogenedentota bacterium]